MPDTLIITPTTANKNYWRDLWRFRELFYILSWRDLKVRYKQTVIGAAWSIIRPILTTIVFTFVFSRVAKLPTHGSAPYLLMVFVGMMPWQFFANALNESSNSLVGNANLITKVYFPRMIIPASSIITSLVDFIISMGLLAILFFIYHFVPSWKIILLPLVTLMTLVIAFGSGLYLTALNVKYRDFRFIIPFIIQFGLYITPVGFNSSVIPEKYKWLYALNPLVGVIDGFRWCILDEPFKADTFIISMIVSILMLLVGLTYFRKTERSFADNI